MVTIDAVRLEAFDYNDNLVAGATVPRTELDHNADYVVKKWLRCKYRIAYVNANGTLWCCGSPLGLR